MADNGTQRMSVEDLLHLHSNEALTRKRHLDGMRAEHGDDTRVSTVYDRKAAEMARNPAAWGQLDEPIRNGTIDPVLLSQTGSGHTVVTEGQHRIVRAHQLGVGELPVSYDPGSQQHRYDWEEPEPLDERTAAVLGDDSYYHGTHLDLAPGDTVEPGHPKNWGYSSPEHLYLSVNPWTAGGYGDISAYRRGMGTGQGRIYQVEPTGPVGSDENSRTHADYPENRVTEHPARVLREVSRDEARNIAEERRQREYRETGIRASGAVVVREVPPGEARALSPSYQEQAPAYAQANGLTYEGGIQRQAEFIPAAEQHENVRNILENYDPSDGHTWDDVRSNFNWEHPHLRAMVEDIRRNGVRRPIPIDYEATPAQVMNGHTRLLAAERAGRETVPVRQHAGFMDPDDPDPQGRQPYDPGHWTQQPEYQDELKAQYGPKDGPSVDYKDSREASLLGHFETADAPMEREASGVDDYGMGHRPLRDGAPAHDLTEGYQEDIYTHPHYWSGGGPPNRAEREGLKQLRDARGNPDYPVTVYRASPPGAPYMMHTGDWVSLSPSYARQHLDARTHPEGWFVHKAVVPARHVRDAGTAQYTEQGYWGPDVPSEHHWGERPEMTREASSPEDTSYRMQHQGPDADEGEGLHEIGSGKIWPRDFHERPWEYSLGADGETMDKVLRSRDWPGRKVWVYRALPSPHREVNPGDWVSTSASYARSEGRATSNGDDDYPVVKFQARAEHLRNEGNSLDEWSYHGPRVNRALVHFSGGKNHRGKGPRGGKTDAMAYQHEPPEMFAAYEAQNRERRDRKRAERAELEQRMQGGQREAAVQHQGSDETAPEGHQVWAVPAEGRSPVAAEVYRNMTTREPADEHGSNWYHGISYHGPYHVIRHPQTRQVWLVDRHGRDASPTGGHYGNPERDGNWGEHRAWEHQYGLESAGPEAHRFGTWEDMRLNEMDKRVPEFPHSRVDPEDEERVRRPEPRVHAPEGVSPSDEYHGSYEVVKHPETGRYHVVDNAGRSAHVLPLNGHATQLQAERSRDYTEKRQQSKEIGRGIANSLYEGGSDALDPGGTAESRQSDENIRSGEELMTRYHGGPGQFKFEPDEEGGAPYYEREHHLPGGRPSGWYVKHKGSAPRADVYHRATGDEAHDTMWMDEDEHGNLPDTYGDHDLEHDLREWHDRPDGTRRYLEEERPEHGGNARIQRWKRQHLGAARFEVVAHFEDPEQPPSGNAREELPPDPGTAPIPEGHVRLWHYTPLENVPSVREHGLLFSHARSDAGNGDLTEPSAGVWASTNQPKGILSDHSGHAAVVEFHMHPSEISDYAESPWRAMNKDRSYDPEKLAEWNSGHHHVIIKGDVKPDRFVAIHEPWHGAARYMRKSGPLSEYQWVKDDYARGGNDHLEPYVRGLNALEGGHQREAAVAALVNPDNEAGVKAFGRHWSDSDTPETWYHGSPYAYHHMDPGQAADLEADMDEPSHTHWNSLLGSHFAAGEGTAANFVHSSSSGNYEGDRSPGYIYHARLHVRNPKHYASEFDMDREVYGHEFDQGNHPVNHDDFFEEEHEGDPSLGHHEDLREQPETLEVPDRITGGAKHVDNRPRYMRWLSMHPDKAGIAQRFKDCLEAAGHDGITYGNELEENNGARGGTSAIAFHPHQVQVTQRHEYDPRRDMEYEHAGNPYNCKHGDEARWEEGHWPSHDQPELPFGEHQAAIEVAAESKTYWDDLRPRIEAEHARSGEHERTVARMEAVSGPDDQRYAYTGEGGHSCPSCKHWWEHEAREDVSDMEPVSWGHMRKYGDPARGEECQYCNDQLTWPRPHTAAECGDTSECPSSMADILHGKDILRLGPTDIIEDHWRHNHFDPGTPPHVEGDEPFTPDSTRHRHRWGTPDDWHAELAEHHELAGRERAEREAGHAVDQMFTGPEHDEARHYLEGNEGGSAHLSALDHGVVAHFEEGPLPEYGGEQLYHGTRSILEPGEHLTVEEAGRHPNNPDIQTDPYVHATTDPREARRWGERANAYQTQRRMTEAGRERRIGPGENAGHAYRPRVYEVHPTGPVEPDLEYADTEHDSWRSAHPMRVGREVEPLTCYDCPDAGRSVEHWPDHPHYEYLRQQADEDEADAEERGRTAALEATATRNHWDMTEAGMRLHLRDEHGIAGPAEDPALVHWGEHSGDVQRHVHPDLEQEFVRAANPSIPQGDAFISSPDSGPIDPVFGSHLHPEAALTGGPNQLSAREERGDRWHEYQNGANDHYHRGIITALPDHLDAYVHDESVPRENRAAALQQHFADSGEGLGMHWTPHPRIAQRSIRNAADAGHGLSDGRLYRGEPETNMTEVMFHVRRPGERNRLPAREHDEHEVGWKYSPDEDEFPLRPGSPLRLAGISWKRHEPQYPNEPMEHHDFARPARHVSSRVAAGHGGHPSPPLPEEEAMQARTAALPEVVAHFSAPGHFEFYDGEGSEDGKPRTPQLEEHLHGHGGDLGHHYRLGHDMEAAWEEAYNTDPPSQRFARYHSALQGLHRGEHERMMANAQEAVQHGAGPEHPADVGLALEGEHHQQWDDEQQARRDHEEAVREHLEDGEAHMHGRDVPFSEMTHHLQSVHGIPHDALPEHRLPHSDYDDPYQRELEEVHEQHHGEHTLPDTGSYRHTPHGQYVTMHWGPRTDFDAEHHLVEHHGMDINELRHEEPDLEDVHRRDHEENRRYLSHHLYTVMDPEGHLPEHHGYQGPDADELREGDPEHHFEVRSRGDDGNEHSGIYHAEDEDHAREMHEEAHPYDEEAHHVGRAPVIPPRRQYTMPAAEHGGWAPAIGPLQPPGDEPDYNDTAFTYQHQHYMAPPRSREDLWSHLREHHGVTQSAGSTKEPGQQFMIGLHDRFHAGEMPDRGTPHQHDVPEGGRDPVFGSRQAGALVAHFEGAESLPGPAGPASHQHDDPGDHRDPVLGRRGPVTLDSAHDIVLAPCGPLEAVIEAAAALGSWRPQDAAEAAALAQAFPQVLSALRDALLRVCRMLEDLPVHPDVTEALHEAARALTAGISDAERTVAGLPTEASWETPGGSPNR